MLCILIFQDSLPLPRPVGCKRDDECPFNQACLGNRPFKCQDPCTNEPCGVNAICEVKNHRALCICPPKHTGDPYRRCRPYECLSDTDCLPTLTCRHERCVDRTKSKFMIDAEIKSKNYD